MKTNPLARSLLAIQLVALSGLAGISAVPRYAHASAELDRKYALETIGTLRSWDNVDGLFADYVASAYRDFFSRQGRFRLQDLSKADSLLSSSKLPYGKAIEDPQILGQLSRSLKTESLIRTRIFKEGPQYRFKIEWLHSPEMEALASEEFTLVDSGGATGGEPSDGSKAHDFAGLGDIKGRLQSALKSLFAKVPFVGQVTGRDGTEVTLNLGANAGLRRGDTLIVGTIDEVKKHPLLKEIVEWRMAATGRVEVESVDDAMAFGRISSQEEGREVARFQKILQIIPRSEKPAAPVIEKAVPAAPNLLDEPPTIGYGWASLWTGGFSREFSAQNGSVGFTGGGFLYGARGGGEVWLNRDWFVDLNMGFGAFGYSQNDIATGLSAGSGASGSVFTLNFDVGYTYYITGDFFGPRAWAKAGYMVASYTLPVSTAQATAPYGVKSVFLGIGGDLPIQDKFGARVDLQFGLFNSGSENGDTNGSINSSEDALLSISAYYRYRPRINFSVGFEMQSTGSDFASGASLSQKTIAVLPSIQYFF